MDLVASAQRAWRARRSDVSIALARHRADTNDPVVADKRELADAIDVDEDVVASQPKVQCRHETLSACQDLCVVPVLCQQ